MLQASGRGVLAHQEGGLAVPELQASREEREIPTRFIPTPHSGGPHAPAHRVLAVDDDDVFRHYVRGLLEQAGYEVTEAADGMEGLARATTGKPDVILLDLMLPKCDGYEVCQHLQEKVGTRHIPVVMITGSSSPDLNRRAYAAGAVACIPKPCRREAVLATVAALIGSAERQRARTEP